VFVFSPFFFVAFLEFVPPSKCQMPCGRSDQVLVD